MSHDYFATYSVCVCDSYVSSRTAVVSMAYRKVNRESHKRRELDIHIETSVSTLQKQILRFPLSFAHSLSISQSQ